LSDLDGGATLAAHRIGDWTCQCGQAYRVLAMPDGVRMWPRNSNNGFARAQVDGSCVCGAPISPGTVLSALFGAVTGQGDPLTTAA
jgi:hypothetical protein